MDYLSERESVILREDISYDLNERTLPEVIETLQKWLKVHPTATFEIVRDYAFGEPVAAVELSWVDWETEVMYRNRKIQMANRLAQEKSDYERLKKKFEG